MVLEQVYWISGIAAAAVATLALLLKIVSKSRTTHSQNISVSGKNNTVNQKAVYESKKE